MKRIVAAAALLAIVVGWRILAGPAAPKESYRDWKTYGGTPAGIRYSTLTQIHRGNVAQLRVAWTFDTHDEFKGSEMECNPIVADGVLYATTPRVRVIALDAATGKLRWSFDPAAGNPANSRQRNRGVTLWGEGRERRVFFVSRGYLYALDAATGRPVVSFGKDGRVDLREGLGRDPESLTVSASSPGVVYKDLLILGSLLPEDLPAAPGDIRAYDARTGKIRWTFHTIPHPGEFGYDTWPKEAWKSSGGANNWPGMAVDAARGIVFAPTGSAAFDFYGADRIGDDLFANCLLALRADTGERLWHFQTVRHDLWDRDLPSAPSLVTVKRDGRMVDAVAQITKSAHVFVFDRVSGKPLFPIEYRTVPKSDVEGEMAAATQPLPLLPPPFARQAFTEDIVTKRTPAAHAAVLERLRQLRSAGQFVPPSLQGTVVYPGLDGGGEWGGAAFDPETALLYVNSNERVQTIRLIERRSSAGPTTASKLFAANCASCHQPERKGGDAPPLAGAGSRFTAAQVAKMIRKGNGRMPALTALSGPVAQAIAEYVTSGVDARVTVPATGRDANGLKYKLDANRRLYDPDGYPAVEPPWGALTAINLNSGAIAWTMPLGEFPELAAAGLRNTGSENYGGPVVTAGGIVFIGATNYDRKFHAFDKANGALLWETTLPAAGNATPAVFELGGREFIVIAAGGGKNGARAGGSYVAFALPEKPR